MKLIEWAHKQGISYLTAYRWFKAGDPRLADAYQSDSGTIIVPSLDINAENTMESVTLPMNAMSAFIKKTVEFSKNNGAIEDFAAWVLSNFNLIENSNSDIRKPTKAEIKKRKQTDQEIQNHYRALIENTVEKNKIKVAEAALNYSGINLSDTESEVLDTEFKSELSYVFNNEKESYENYKSGMLQKPPLSPDLMENITKALDFKKEKSALSISSLGTGSFVKSEKNELCELKEDLDLKDGNEKTRNAAKLIKNKKKVNLKTKKN